MKSNTQTVTAWQTAYIEEKSSKSNFLATLI